jgi:hypothetical protein
MIELLLRIMTNGTKGPLVIDNLVFTPKAFWRIDQFRQATGETLIPGQVVVFNADDAIDRKGRVILTVDSFNGRDRNKVAKYVVEPGTANQSSSIRGQPLVVSKSSTNSTSANEEADDIPY